jgi:hypothetical protein
VRSFAFAGVSAGASAGVSASLQATLHIPGRAVTEQCAAQQVEAGSEEERESEPHMQSDELEMFEDKADEEVGPIRCSHRQQVYYSPVLAPAVLKVFGHRRDCNIPSNEARQVTTAEDVSKVPEATRVMLVDDDGSTKIGMRCVEVCA